MDGKYSVVSIKRRLLTLFIVIAFIFFILIVRLGVVQISNGKDLQMKAVDQWTRDLPVTPKRGLIVDRNGEILADSQTTYIVYLRAKNVTEPEKVAKLLSDVLGLDYTETLKKANNKGVSEITLKRKVTKEQITKLIEGDVKGIYYSEDILRTYPNNEILAQVLGYNSIDNVGQCGIEQYYDKILRGIPGQKLTESDIRGVEIDGSVGYYMPPTDGLNLQLTIDLKIQKITENVMQQAYLANKPLAARALVMDAQTGEILSMANVPSVDLNNLDRNDLDTLMKLSKNPLLTDIYEPGSTFKILTAAATMQEYANGNTNAFSPSHIFSSGQFRMVDGQRIKCWSNHANGKHTNQTIQEALNNSCNPCFVDMALALGTETFYDYLDKFGYGKQTGIDAIGERTGMLLKESSVKNCDLARIGFGQTIAVTPLQLVAATASAVNGGKLMQPYLAKKIYSNDGYVAEKFEPIMKNRTIDESVSRQLASYLEGVVRDGSGKHAYIPGYKVGGKTGTAQKYVDGHIAQGKYISSFVGFFPSNAPKYIALVVIDEPQGQSYGSIVAAPCAKQIFEQIIQLKNIPPAE